MVLSVHTCSDVPASGAQLKCYTYLVLKAVTKVRQYMCEKGIQGTSSIVVGSAPDVRMKMVGVRGLVSGRMLSMVQG